jgi:tetratricopeptide (TPR) repeat protein
MLALLLLWASALTPEQNAKVLSYLLKSQYALVRDQFTQAKEHADRALALDPQSADAAFLRLEIMYSAMRRTPIQLQEQRQRYLEDLKRRLIQFPDDYRFPQLMGQLMVENRWIRQDHPQPPEFYLKEALRLMEAGDLATNEEKADTYFDLGRWYYTNDQPYKATLAFSKIEDLDPDNIRSMEALAKSAQNAHMLRLALRSFKKYSKRSSFDFESRATPVGNAIYMLEYILDPKPEKLQDLIDYCQRTDQDLSLLTRVGDRMAFMGMEAKIPELLAEVPETLHSRRYYQLLLLGLMMRQDFKEIIEIAKTKGQLYSNELRVTIMEHGMEAALLEGDYETCLNFAAENQAVSRVSSRFELYGSFAAALRDGDLEPWQAMADRRGPEDRMVMFVQNALSSMTFEDFAFRNKLQLLRQFRAYDQVIQQLDARFPEGIPDGLLEERAITHILAGEPEKAFPIYEQLLAAHPDRADYYNNYGYFLADANQELEKSKSLIARALELEPDNPAYLDSYGWAHYRLGDMKTAEQYVREALRFEPDNAEKLEHLGDIYRRLGKEDIAREYWSQAMEQGGDRYLKIMEKLDP